MSLGRSYWFGHYPYLVPHGAHRHSDTGFEGKLRMYF